MWNRPACALLALLVLPVEAAAQCDGYAPAEAGGDAPWPSSLFLAPDAIEDRAHGAVVDVGQRLIAAIELEPPEAQAELWAPGAEGRTLAREPQPGRYDLVQPPAVVEAVRRAAIERSRWDRATDPDGVGLVCARVDLDGDEARLRGQVLEVSFSGEETFEQGVSLRLRRVSGRWRVHSLRVWPERYAYYDESDDYSPASWRRADRAVHRARRAARGARAPLARRRALVRRLRAAMRTEEAADEAAAVCDDPRAEIDDCLFAAPLSWDLGRDARAHAQRRRAAELLRELVRWHERDDPCPDGTSLLDRRGVPGRPHVACADASGDLRGPITYFHPSGRPARVGRYEDDRPAGTWLELDERGHLAGRIRY